jgi:hypothetical protein
MGGRNPDIFMAVMVSTLDIDVALQHPLVSPASLFRMFSFV